LSRIFKKIENDIKRHDKEALKKFELIQKLEKHLQEGKWISTFPLNEKGEDLIKEYNFLTKKPLLLVLNVDSSISEEEIKTIKDEIAKTLGHQIQSQNILALDLANELNLAALTEEEAKELDISRPAHLNALDDLIKKGYQILDLITFFTTTGPEETRAWPLKRGSTAWEAAGLIHKDFQKKFIKAEIVSWRDFVELKSWVKCRELGKLKIEGRDYIVQDGDIIYYKI